MFHSVTETAMSGTGEVCLDKPELLAPITTKTPESPNPILEGRRPETPDSPPRSRKRKVHCSSAAFYSATIPLLTS